jgi:hypothetical protein
MKLSSSGSNRWDGASLVVVVVGVVVLAAILHPEPMGDREKMRVVSCVGNLKMIGLAMDMS